MKIGGEQDKHTSGLWPFAAINKPPTRTKGRQNSAANYKSYNHIVTPCMHKIIAVLFTTGKFIYIQQECIQPEKHITHYHKNNDSNNN